MLEEDSQSETCKNLKGLQLPALIWVCWTGRHWGFNGNVVDSFPVPKSCHEPEGILIAKGPDIRIEGERPVASIMDLAPTVLHILGLSIPKDMDGEVLQGIFREESEPLTRRVSYAAPVEREESDKVAFSGEQENFILGRLRGLGYLD